MSFDLETTLVGHLRKLARRETWRVYELPEGIAERPAAILRLLDKRGWIEVRLWERAERNPRAFEDPHDFVIRPNAYIGWFPPLRSPRTAGTWDGIVQNYTGELAPEVRLTELGKAKLDEVSVAASKPEKKPSGRPADTDPGHVSGIGSWVVHHKDQLILTMIAVLLAAFFAWLGLG